MENKWIKATEDNLPELHPIDGYRYHYESHPFICAINNGEGYVIGFYCTGQESPDDEKWEAWIDYHTEEIIENVTHYMPYEKLPSDKINQDRKTFDRDNFSAIDVKEVEGNELAILGRDTLAEAYGVYMNGTIKLFGNLKEATHYFKNLN